MLSSVLIKYALFCCSLLVDGKIDKNRDGKVTKDELKDWIKFASKRYIYEDVDRQWDHLKKLTESRLTSQGLPVEKGSTDAKSPIGWMEYRNNTYGYVSSEANVLYSGGEWTGVCGTGSFDVTSTCIGWMEYRNDMYGYVLSEANARLI